MKIDRLVGIITILLQQERVTAPELAKRFEVSRRTINRDIEDICRAGIPLVTTQGYGGGISIAEGFTLDRSLLTEEELQLILSGVKGLDSVSETSYAQGLSEKLSAAAADDILIDLASHYQAPLTRKIAVIRSAIRNRRHISFRYYYEKGQCRRTIEPYKLVFRWSAWYVWGWCLEREAFRLFKLNRLWELEPFNSLTSIFRRERSTSKRCSRSARSTGSSRNTAWTASGRRADGSCWSGNSPAIRICGNGC